MSFVRVCSVTLGLVAGACTAPNLTVDAEPPGTRIQIDGVERGVGSVTMRQPYYGVARIEAVPPPAEFPGPRKTAARMVELDPPITQWLFPFDLLFEIAHYPWRQPGIVVELETEPHEVPEQGEKPPTDELRGRALQSLTGR